MKKQTLILAIIPVLIAVFAVSFYAIGWTEPSSAPPGGNIDLPLNTGAVTQVKEGALAVHGLLNAQSDLIVDNDICFGTDCRNTWPEASVPTVFGARTNLDSNGAVLMKDVVYLATGDGFINSWFNASDTSYIKLYVGTSAGNVNTLIDQDASQDGGGEDGSIMSLIKAGEYIRVYCYTCARGNWTLWTPIGSSQLIRQ